MQTLTEFCPAKLNLYLAVTGRRADGFHELVSVVVPLNVGDTLTVAPAAAGQWRLTCDDPAVPTGEDNLVMKAVRAFVAATGWAGGATFHLAKQVPMGAGLGGGSSDAAGALRALNRLAGQPLDQERLAAVAAAVGSDCPMFIYGGAVTMRGRGERIDPLPAAVAGRWRGRRLLVFKPAFGIDTVWAYRRLAAEAPESYQSPDTAEARLRDWLDRADAPPEELGFNALERPAFAKFAALPVLLGQLRRDFGLAPRMSGSGSACYAWLPDDLEVAPVQAVIRDSWGETAWIRVAAVMESETRANPD